MADNVQTTFGQFATDDVGGVHIQRVRLDVGAEGASASGPTPYRNLDLGVTGQVLKASAGRILLLVATNQHASAKRYLKIYDKATAPTQADTPVMTIPLTAGVTVPLIALITGVVFAAGISMRATTAIADNDTGAPTANDVVIAAATV